MTERSPRTVDPTPPYHFDSALHPPRPRISRARSAEARPGETKSTGKDLGSTRAVSRVFDKDQSQPVAQNQGGKPYRISYRSSSTQPKDISRGQNDTRALSLGVTNERTTPRRALPNSRRSSSSEKSYASNSTGDGASDIPDDDEKSPVKLATADLQRRLEDREHMRSGRRSFDYTKDIRSVATEDLGDEISLLHSYLCEDIPGLKQDAYATNARIRRQQEALRSRMRELEGHSNNVKIRATLEQQESELERLRKDGLQHFKAWEQDELEEGDWRLSKLRQCLDKRRSRQAGFLIASPSSRSAVSENGKDQLVIAPASLPQIVISDSKQDVVQPAKPDSRDSMQVQATTASVANQLPRSHSTGDISSIASCISIGSDGSTITIFDGWATIAEGTSHERGPCKVRLRADTGADDNWVSLEVLERVGIEDQVQELQYPRRFRGVGGDVETRKTVQLTVCSTNSAYSRRIQFFVLENAPFDMILGGRFIKRNGFAFAMRPVFPLRTLRPSKEKKAEMEEQKREKQKENERLARERKAEQAAQRERDRERKRQGTR